MPLNRRFFSHQLTRKYVVAFGSLFRDIQTVKYNSDGTERTRVNVPLSYSPKNEYFYKLAQDRNLDNKSAIVLPRMGFEITGFQYAPQRKLVGHKRFRATNSNDNNAMDYVYTPVPYDIDFSLYITSKSQDEAFQIMEQIVPFFAPDFPITLKGVTGLELSYDTPVSLMGVNYMDDYEGELSKTREVNFEMSFVMKAVYFGPSRSGDIIREVIVDGKDTEDDSINYFNLTVEPYIQGVATSEISADDDYGFSTEIVE